MSVIPIASWFEAVPRRRLVWDLPVSVLMTTSDEAAELGVVLPWGPSVDAGATVEAAAHVMASTGSRQVLVNDETGTIVGVLTASALYRWVAEGDRILG